MQGSMNMAKPVITLQPGLYLVATPIGNLRDITLRALDVLQAAGLVVCEDTRVTGKLLSSFGLKKKLLPYNDHNAPRQRVKVLEAIAEGNAVAMVSDAGMPLVSDPGYKLVRECIDRGYAVTTVPGANAPLAALQLSGLPSDRFVFLGFLPPKSQARKKALAEWARTPATLILFETGPRLPESLADMASVLGARPAAVVREITKMFEEARRASLPDLAAHYEAQGQPKGEIVVVIGPPAEEQADEKTLAHQLRYALQTMSVRDAAAFVAEASGRPKKEVYEMALEITGEK
jgi:16S rRNA (cytidine1402-2'-O)-methyltransferase